MTMRIRVNCIQPSVTGRAGLTCRCSETNAWCLMAASRILDTGRQRSALNQLSTSGRLDSQGSARAGTFRGDASARPPTRDLLFEDLADQKLRDPPVGLRIRMSIPRHQPLHVVLAPKEGQQIEHRYVQFMAPVRDGSVNSSELVPVAKVLREVGHHQNR